MHTRDNKTKKIKRQRKTQQTTDRIDHDSSDKDELLASSRKFVKDIVHTEALFNQHTDNNSTDNLTTKPNNNTGTSRGAYDENDFISIIAKN